MGYQSFENLDVWKRACRLSVRLYTLLRDSREYGLKDQINRAAVSIASNIAEGAERETTREFKRYLTIAKGSAAELRTQVYIAGEIEVLTSSQQQEIVTELKEISSMLHGLIGSLKT